MNILVTGGCGNIGVHVVEVFANKGHSVRVIDKDAEGLKRFNHSNIETLEGDISDKDFIVKALEGIDAVIHLAWSFSKDPLVLFDTDVKGYTYLLNAAVQYNVQHVINASTAVAYGKPQYSPVDEDHPRVVEKARKPMYALAKFVTEKLGLIYAQEHNLAVNTAMIWWAYGDEIGGKHIRAMIKDVIEKGELVVPKDCGGSFLQLDDFVTGLEGILDKKPIGQTYNFGTIYLTWEELAEIIVSRANPQAKIIAVPKEEWKGSTFLTDDWKFSTAKAEKELGYRSHFSREEAVSHLGKALEACISEVRESL
jgi:UDP-glucose 4-epimerase